MSLGCDIARVWRLPRPWYMHMPQPHPAHEFRSAETRGLGGRRGQGPGQTRRAAPTARMPPSRLCRQGSRAAPGEQCCNASTLRASSRSDERASECMAGPLNTSRTSLNAAPAQGSHRRAVPTMMLWMRSRVGQCFCRLGLPVGARSREAHNASAIVAEHMYTGAHSRNADPNRFTLARSTSHRRTGAQAAREYPHSIRRLQMSSVA